jgi:hypothetical protein
MDFRRTLPEIRCQFCLFPVGFLGYHDSGAFLQSRCWPFYFDPTSQNRESHSILALVSKLLAVRRKGEA